VGIGQTASRPTRAYPCPTGVCVRSRVPAQRLTPCRCPRRSIARRAEHHQIAP
jgi:hypothetical protein